jgi:hypothetical protein
VARSEEIVMTTATSQTAAPATPGPTRSAARGSHRIDLLGAGALLVSVLGLTVVVLLLKPGAAPLDMRPPLDVSMRTHDDWALAAPAARSLEVSPRTHDDWMFTASTAPSLDVSLRSHDDWPLGAARPAASGQR